MAPESLENENNRENFGFYGTKIIKKLKELRNFWLLGHQNH